jgi:hypothetical protein
MSSDRGRSPCATGPLEVRLEVIVPGTLAGRCAATRSTELVQRVGEQNVRSDGWNLAGATGSRLNRAGIEVTIASDSSDSSAISERTRRVWLPFMWSFTVNGSYTTPSMSAAPFDVAAGIVEVADYLQERVIDNAGPVWPVCPSHGFGLHPQVNVGRAMWWCRPLDHPVSVVGELRT